ncbi:hypothetical protein XANCAGTX0491_003211 [Xanthoria calcicola]
MEITPRPCKRLNQTDISSYLTIHSTSAHPSHKTPASPHLQSQLPPTIQSSLLNVGMRVRKAVPEGYKTTKRILDPNTLYSGTGGTGRSAELVPYCGISKVGGYMAQPQQPPSLPDYGNENDVLRNGMLFEDDDEGLGGDGNSSVPPPPSSQESVLEPDSALRWSRGAKRTLIHDEEEENEHGAVGVGRSNNENLRLVGMNGSMALRPIAQARNRPRRDGTTRVKGACEGDFGEAPFLRDWCEAMDF